jgi:hypothetical protein
MALSAVAGGAASVKHAITVQAIAGLLSGEIAQRQLLQSFLNVSPNW